MDGTQGSNYHIPQNPHTSSFPVNPSKQDNQPKNSSLVEKVDSFAEPLFSQINQKHNPDVRLLGFNNSTEENDILLKNENDYDDLLAEFDEFQEFIEDNKFSKDKIDSIIDQDFSNEKLINKQIDNLNFTKSELVSINNGKPKLNELKEIIKEKDDKNILEISDIDYQNSKLDLENVYVILENKKDGLYLRKINTNDTNELVDAFKNNKFVELKDDKVFIVNTDKKLKIGNKQKVLLLDDNGVIIKKEVTVSHMSNRRFLEIKSSIMFCVRFLQKIEDIYAKTVKDKKHNLIQKEFRQPIIHRLSIISKRIKSKDNDVFKDILKRIIALANATYDELERAEKKKEMLQHDKKQKILKKEIIDYIIDKEVETKNSKN